jgi:hypothetical protein
MPIAVLPTFNANASKNAHDVTPAGLIEFRMR